ncbi:hypothetical protein ABFS82_06G120000 [Erythranthe guttata]
MHRSASSNRVREGHHLSYHNNSSASSSKLSSLDADELPLYDPFSDAAKKEKGGARFAEGAVHIIPFVLLFCVFVLWFFSTPPGKLHSSVFYLGGWI